MNMIDESIQKNLSEGIDTLFLNAPNSDRFEELKKGFMAKWTSVKFVHTKVDNFEYRRRIVLEFKTKNSFKQYLEYEMNLALKSQDFETASNLRNVITRNDEPESTDLFYLHYGFEPSDAYLKVVFKTNSLVFRYGVVGM